MRMRTKVWLMIAGSLVLIGFIVFASAMSTLKWDFTKLSTFKYENNDYEIHEAFQHISVITDTADIVFVPSKGSIVSVSCYEQESNTGDVTGSLLTDKVFITETSTGRISVPKTISGGKCEITTSTGDIKIDIQ